MAQFNDWCFSVDEQVGNHFRRVMTGQAASIPIGIQATAAIVPAHYASEEQVARALARLGKPEAAALIEGKLPTTKAIRSGDLGEIYATEWIDGHSGGYRAPIKRLRWKDHRNMAMRGDDVIGIFQDPQTQRLHFLKTEAKSRVALTAQVLNEARAGLDKSDGLPSAHALSFISARLLELNQLPLADAIDDALLKHGISSQNVRHLLFTFSGNAPDALLTASLQAYPGPINQWGVGLRVEGHAAFIGAVYDRVVSDANNA
ncbi:Hachiman antiphage defense system protein HamA [Variovorax sp. YR750]|uniref:Hachiman antiphage defense system protein HamA n=1 Tax=Variovorax sp. YR750 TaxID=1884384 RepID=UPI000B843A61|nr:Hachiman antiphage defense system protein HamA [Variovorax sp. YR750]